MELNEFKTLLKSGKLGGVYIFSGEEDYLKRYYLAELKSRILTDEGMAVFNHAVYDGGDIDFSALTDDVMAPPMFEEYKLIEWRYPDLEGLKESELERLDELIELVNETEYAVLAFLAADGAIDFGTAKKPGKLVKRLADKVKLLRFDRSTDAQLLSWLKKHFDAEGVSVNIDVLNALIFRAGRSMAILNNEVIKLSMLARARGQSAISVADVEETSSSTVECDTYAFSNSLLEKNKRAAFFALEEMKAERQDPLMILGIISKTFSDIASVAMMLRDGTNQADMMKIIPKMNQYKLKLTVAAAKRYGYEVSAKILEELARVDTGAKFGGVTGYTAIELFIAKYL